ncbi:GlsB/YeaQ/YmgE family stress response membrane protein [Kitasatospora sp. NBC_00374]|uniref:GlsB/YeaQ/YmgE family stress response membrane protein n=1 Tax=Kitasatospora sp. NBC_00374 TaxID=2975964 RepID=UPI0030E095EA
MSILWAILAGLVIGLLAKLVLPGRQAIPLWLTVLLGIVGGLIGNSLAAALGVRDTGGVDWVRHLLQVGAAALLIGLVGPAWSRRGR